MRRALPSAPGVPLRHGLLVRNPGWNTWLRVRDAFLRATVNRTIAEPTTGPVRVVLGVGGHLGDAVISTSILSVLREHAPTAEIGIVSGSWNHAVFAAHPAVRWFHGVDHWKVSRSGAWLGSRWRVARRTEAEATREMRDVGYDAAIDLSPYYPNFAAIFARAGIATRVGFPTGGGGPLYTTQVRWEAGRHVAQDHLALLRTLFPAIPRDVVLRCDLPQIPSDASRRVRERLAEHRLDAGNYIVIQPGAGEARKEWLPEHWIAVVDQLRAAGDRAVLTGAGVEQGRLAERIASAVPGVVNLSGRLTFDEFRGVIAGARLVLSVDTVAMHLAAASRAPCVALMTAMDDPARWRPLSDTATPLWHAVPCAPCYRSRGCAHMACVRGITPAAVLRAADVFSKP